MSEPLTFASDSDAPTGPAPWLLLVVDDDPEVHAVTRMMLGPAQFEGRGVSLLHANSAKEARPLLRQHRNIALALLDVVMETEQAGLDLVRYIREVLDYQAMRIVLRTGQPGQAPAQDVAAQYSIDDYVSKAELTYERLRILVTTGLRAHAQIKRLERSAHQDPLTGLLNRRRFEQQVQQGWEGFATARLPVAALMIDVDHFKDYNDTYGHPEGDRMLVEVTRVLSRNSGRNALICRYGGEEFVVLLPGVSLQHALGTAEWLRQSVANQRLPHRQSVYGIITISIGVSAVEAAEQLWEVGYEQLIRNADQALYRAKRSGRNRVEAQVPGTAAADGSSEPA